MRLATWTIRLAVLLFLLAFAVKNAEPVPLRFYFDLTLNPPLVLLLFGFFAGGALFGVLALLGRVLRQRREISGLKKQLQAPAPAEAAPLIPPPI